MAQTKRKRRSKHRGTPAGTIQARGRTGRKPTDQETKASRATDARARREARLDRPPSWRSAANRALIATAIFLVAVLVLFRQKPAAAVSLALFMLALYIPLGYYTDLFLYRRRQKQKEKAAQARRSGRESR
jgi:hypothetical protein